MHVLVQHIHFTDSQMTVVGSLPSEFKFSLEMSLAVNPHFSYIEQCFPTVVHLHPQKGMRTSRGCIEAQRGLGCTETQVGKYRTCAKYNFTLHSIGLHTRTIFTLFYLSVHF